MTQRSVLDINILPEAIKDERIAELAPKLQNETIEQGELDEIILGFLRLAFHVVNHYSLQGTQERLWLQAEAMFAIVKAVLRAKGRIIENLKGYIVATIDRYIRCKRSLLRVPPSTNRARIKRGVHAIHITVRRLLSSTAMPKNMTTEILEEIKICTDDEFEQKIIELKRAGFKDLEVAEKLQVSRQCVGRIKKKIKLRFRMRNDEWGEF